MKLMAMVFVSDLDRAINFYRALGLREDQRHGDVWAVLCLGDALLGLHRTDALPSDQRLRVKLSFEIGGGQGGRLEEVRNQLAAAGVTVEAAIEDQPWGRSLTVVDPDGLPIEIAESA